MTMPCVNKHKLPVIISETLFYKCRPRAPVKVGYMKQAVNNIHIIESIAETPALKLLFNKTFMLVCDCMVSVFISEKHINMAG
jgi:hypothetical protein